jgi:hypothetical protein
MAWRLVPGAIAYVWHAALKATTVAADLETAGFTIRSQIIWVKQHFALSRGDYHYLCVCELADPTSETDRHLASRNDDLFGGSFRRKFFVALMLSGSLTTRSRVFERRST